MSPVLSAMESEQAKTASSGATTPDNPKTPKAASSVGASRLRRSDSQETLLTAITEATVESTSSEPSLVYPGPPLNSPVTQSEAGDLAKVDVTASTLTEKLNAMPADLSEMTPPTSQTSARDNEERVVRLKREETPTPTKRASKESSAPIFSDQSNAATSAEERMIALTPNKHFPEHSTWASVAEEDVMLGLKRLAMLARDEHRLDSSKSVEYFYSQRLASLIKGGELSFDFGSLQ